MSNRHPRRKERKSSQTTFRDSQPDSAGGLSPTRVPEARKSVRPWMVFLGLAILSAFAFLATVGVRTPAKNQYGQKEVKPYVRRPAGAVTFTKDIAPIVFKNCVSCHRPDQAAPFSLLNYADARKHARQIADVTARRYMPPWLPEPGYGDFAGERRLSAEELGLIQQWAAEGAIEGDPADLPPLPSLRDGWQLGPPDLVVKMPQPYTLPAEGKDVYRNFVLPIPISAARYVKGVEFLPGNAKVVHHAFINVDETRQARRLAEKQNPPGFDGMELPESASMPGGQLLGWQPGKVPSMVSESLSWSLKPATDLVLQMHLHPSGKRETVDPAIAFYFTDQAPTNVPFRIKLARFDFEIPAGATNYLVEQSYALPTDVSLLRVLPHAHYLGKDLQGYALLPNGEKRWLIRIRDWDFNWQGDYQYAQPIFLPKGARLVMHYSYDNSTHNARNPNQPPKAVRHGLQTTDEMAGLVFQAIARNAEQRSILAKDYFEYFVRVSMDYYRFLLRRNANDAEAHTKLGRALASQGRTGEAMVHLASAVRIKPDDDRAHYELGYLYLLQNRLTAASQEFQTVIQLNPDDYQAFGSLGLICLKEGRLTEAQTYLETALRLNPDDLIARRNLSRLKTVR
jgi:tetratricopeptide (TPR) repeat protein/mono/diheme cytochrome c family protein